MYSYEYQFPCGCGAYPWDTRENVQGLLKTGVTIIFKKETALVVPRYVPVRYDTYRYVYRYVLFYFIYNLPVYYTVPVVPYDTVPVPVGHLSQGSFCAN